jgi:hypothetical protein
VVKTRVRRFGAVRVIPIARGAGKSRRRRNEGFEEFERIELIERID